MKETNTIEPDFAVHPGRLLARVLKQREMTQKELAERTGINKKTINDIVNGTAAITYGTSVGLERVLGVPASFWMNAESIYQTRKKRLEELEEHKNFLKEPALKELVSRRFVPKSKTAEESVNNILRFFRVGSVSVLQSQFPIGVSLRQSQSAKAKRDPLALLCWWRCCELECEKIACRNYDASKFKAAVQKIRSMTSRRPSECFEQIQKMCAECGVAVVAVDQFKNADVKGAAERRKEKAFIMLNGHVPFADIFWFSFFHEAGHILKTMRNFRYIEGWGSRKESDRNRLEEEERKANEFARSLLIPKKYESELPSLKTSQQIAEFADRIGVHPGIVVGRLGHDRHKKAFDELRLALS
ncbi:MAG: HigA family addiction module antidote protein [Thermoguttaceae bacterium]|nr:HigA family addiction module antidote protein [Thermoguttaceae bacterium]